MNASNAKTHIKTSSNSTNLGCADACIGAACILTPTCALNDVITSCGHLVADASSCKCNKNYHIMPPRFNSWSSKKAES